MNKRIQELAEQAGAYVNEVYTPPVRSKTPGKIWEDGHIGWHEQFHKKFAELIVRECIKEIEFQYGGGSDQPMDSEWDRAIECASSMVKYRFGVEK